ncbi:MAG: hypothetical protein HC888_07620 [Candidatus Competibacteraceae bacterium]|nr:hypothetical protein [Candidatus Competibacteraceae bacterium]
MTFLTGGIGIGQISFGLCFNRSKQEKLQMKLEKSEGSVVKAEPALGEKLAGEIWNDKVASEQRQIFNQNQEKNSEHLPGTQIADGGGLYIKFTEDRGLSEVGGYVTTRSGGGEMTLMGGIEFKEGTSNEYLLGFDYKESARHPKKNRSERPTHPPEGNSSGPTPRPDENNHQDKPDRPNRPVRPNQPGNKPSN